MIDVQVAGAGAGKTYGLAKIILTRLRKTTGIQRKIFALTYTNTAKKEIELELIKQNGAIPVNLTVETVHSFLLNEVIFPFSVYVLSIPYKKSSITYLGSNTKFKAYKIKNLKDQGIIHADEVYMVAKQIIDRTNTKNSTKKKKAKVDKVLEILNICIDSIFIDEVQDLDKNALTTFRVLGETEIFLHMTGDPKQAIKWPNDFSNFITKAKKNKQVNLLDPINLTRRVPSCIVNHSNRFCYSDQLQKSKSVEVGKVLYIESSHNEFIQFMDTHIRGKSLVYIDKKRTNTLHKLGLSIAYLNL